MLQIKLVMCSVNKVDIQYNQSQTCYWGCFKFWNVFFMLMCSWSKRLESFQHFCGGYSSNFSIVSVLLKLRFGDTEGLSKNIKTPLSTDKPEIVNRCYFFPVKTLPRCVQSNK